jgi:hypothetical protein
VQGAGLVGAGARHYFTGLCADWTANVLS